jgi:hypothetical protein
MKYTGRKHATYENNQEINQTEDSKTPKTRHNKCQPWHEKHRKAIDETDPASYPNLYETSGKKGKISLTPFESLISDAKQIFNLNPDYFKNTAHVHNLAYYRGMMDLQYQFVVKKHGKPLTTMSQYLKETEHEREQENEIGRALEIIKEYVDKFNKGIITESMYEEKELNLIKIFEKIGLGNRLKTAIDNLFNEGEIQKSRDRLAIKRKRDDAKSKNIKVL